MKKLALIGMMALSTTVFASNIQAEQEWNFKVGHLDIKNSGLKSGTTYGIEYVFNRELGEPGAWGIRISMEGDYAKLDEKDGGNTDTYTEFSIILAPSYTFDNKLRVYAGVKTGYVDLSDNASSDSDSTSGHVISGVEGIEYPVMNHLMIGISAEQGKTYISTEKYSTTKYDGYLGYKF